MKQVLITIIIIVVLVSLSYVPVLGWWVMYGAIGWAAGDMAEMIIRRNR